MPGFHLDDQDQVWELNAVWSYEDDVWHSSRHCLVTIRELGTTQPVLWQMWDDNCRETFTGHRPGYWQLQKVVVRDLWPGTAADWEHIYDPPPTGPFTGTDGTAGPVTPLVQWITEYPGRSYRGRTYWGPVREDEVNNSYASSDIWDWIVVYCQQMMSTFDADAALFPHLPGFFVLSRSHNGVPWATPWVSKVDNASVDGYLRTNRKRGTRQTEPHLAL